MKRELFYAAVVGGCVGGLMIAALGVVLPLGAQSQSDGHFNEIICQRLRVVGAPFTLPNLEIPNVKTEIDGFGVTVSRPGRHSSMQASGIDINDFDDGSITTIGSGSVAVGTTRDMAIGHLRPLVSLQIDEYGGRVQLFGMGNKSARAVMGVNEYGNGAISTWDKNGYRLATLK